MNPVIAVGLFDGVHLGHQSLLQEAVRIGKRLSLPVEAVTFDGLETTKKIFLLNLIQNQLLKKSQELKTKNAIMMV